MRLLAIACALAVITVAAGCAADSQASKQAGQGAAMGAVGGAVAGAVSSMLWGGNVAQGAARGAAVGVAAGAATGAVSGSMADNAQKSAPKPKPAAVDQAELRKKIGDKNYTSALLLAQCRHKDAIASAEETLAASQSTDEKSYALLIQGIAAEESGDRALAASVYSKTGGGADKARADALEGVIKVQAERRAHGLPPCK